jgi:hypothetical protein
MTSVLLDAATFGGQTLRESLAPRSTPGNSEIVGVAYSTTDSCGMSSGYRVQLNPTDDLWRAEKADTQGNLEMPNMRMPTLYSQRHPEMLKRDKTILAAASITFTQRVALIASSKAPALKYLRCSACVELACVALKLSQLSGEYSWVVQFVKVDDNPYRVSVGTFSTAMQAIS